MDLVMIFCKYFEDQGGDKWTCQYFSTQDLISGMILWLTLGSSGKSGCEYKVAKYQEDPERAEV